MDIGKEDDDRFLRKKQKKIKTVLAICRWKRGIFSSKVETRRGIVCPLSILFQAIPGFNAIWILWVSTCFITVAVYEVRWFCFSLCCKGDVNSTLGENSKEPSSSTISTKPSIHNDSKVMKNFLIQMKFVNNYINKMGYKLYSDITCPNPTEGSTENIGEGLHY